jgi:hypothetical protein
MNVIAAVSSLSTVCVSDRGLASDCPSRCHCDDSISDLDAGRRLLLDIIGGDENDI